MDIATENTILGTLEHFGSVGPSDIYPLQPEYSLLLASPTSTAKVIHERLQCFDWSERSAYAPALAGYIETGVGTLRKSLYIDPLLDILLTSLVAQLAPAIEQQRIPIHLNRVFSYRWKPKDGAWFDLEIGWNEFEAEERRYLQRVRFVAIVDIAQFYESIRPSTLEAALRSCSALLPQQKAIMELLSLCHLEDFGLPVGGTASRILAEACLSSIDDALHQEGIHFIRFVDDFRIFADTISDLKKAIWFLGRLLGSQGLSLNNSKTRILTSTDQSDKIDLQPRSLIKRNQLGIASRVIDKFDPYSQLVGQHLEELKKISKTQSLDQALAFELDKLEPSYRSLKLLLGALQFADPDEIRRALSMVFDQLETGKLNRVSLQLERAVSACAKHLTHETKARLSSILWRQVDNFQLSTPDGTVGHWIRAIGHLSESSPSTSPQEWRRRFLNAKHSVIVQRELLRLQIIENTDNLPLAVQEYASYGDPWIRSLYLALTKSRNVLAVQNTQLELVMRQII